MNTPLSARRVRHLAIAWVALLALMLTSLGSAYVPLGPWNPVIGLMVATLKSGIVLVLFMRLPQTTALTRIAALTGLAMLAVLVSLSGVDYLTRLSQPARVQPPAQLAPLFGADTRR